MYSKLQAYENEKQQLKEIIRNLLFEKEQGKKFNMLHSHGSENNEEDFLPRKNSPTNIQRKLFQEAAATSSINNNSFLKTNDRQFGTTLYPSNIGGSVHKRIDQHSEQFIDDAPLYYKTISNDYSVPEPRFDENFSRKSPDNGRYSQKVTKTAHQLSFAQDVEPTLDELQEKVGNKLVNLNVSSSRLRDIMDNEPFQGKRFKDSYDSSEKNGLSHLNWNIRNPDSLSNTQNTPTMFNSAQMYIGKVFKCFKNMPLITLMNRTSRVH